ncbi:major facilitator superfamily MFS-1 protein [Theileria orientalis]|uniref:Major facilitator superfamily MFS-1 protein n=1 Tax=Theileria orientalis TaxID=68886 RepID=A0A976M699_THEOR|nr:major facilitator superfamily MFS-1 protein [Theileria orientalis]
MEYDLNKDVKSQTKARNRVLNSKTFIFSMFNVANFIEYFNLQFLPSSMRALEISLGLSPIDISNFATAESLGLVGFIPVWGALSDKVELKYIMLIGVALSGIISIILGGISNYSFILILRVFNGAMMGSVTPSSQKYIVTHLSNHFGIGFGVMHSVMCAARLASSITVTTFSTVKYGGIMGWRFCLYIFGAVSLALSPVVLLIPNLNPKNEELSVERISIKTRAYNFVYYLYRMFKESLSNATSILMVFMNFFSDGPFVAFSFVTLLLQYMGLSNTKSGLTVGIVIIGGIAGGVIGGFVSDYFNRKSPKYGLIMFGNLNVIVRVLTFCIAFFWVNFDNVDKLFPLLAVSLFINGMTFMTVSCVDRTLLANVVPKTFQSSAISIIRCLSGVAGAVIFNRLLAYIREIGFGFEQTALDVKDMPISLMRKNSNALRYSISIVSLVCTGVVFILYNILCFTYWRDCKRIQKIEAESPVVNPIAELEHVV